MTKEEIDKLFCLFGAELYVSIWGAQDPSTILSFMLKETYF